MRMALHSKLRELEQVILQIRELAVCQEEQVSFEALECELVDSEVDGVHSGLSHNKALLEEHPQDENRIANLLAKNNSLEVQLNECQIKLEALSAENAELSARVALLRSEIIELRGMIRVICRVKPVEQASKVRNSDRFVEIDSKRFMVDRAFGPSATQADVYRELSPLIESTLEGYRVCIFAYGQTGSGKTHTMSGTSENKGIIFRACENLSEAVVKLKPAGLVPQYSITYIEIYNDSVRDLIGNKIVQIKDESGSIRLKDCENITVEDLGTVEDMIERVSLRRTTGTTCSNTQSSRSHSMVIIKIRLQSASEIREGALVLVDLAGSERLSESKAENERLKETQHINKSLSALGNVFAAIKRGDKHIPFRDSRLTYIMREYLSNRSRVAMIVNINPANPSESLCTMRFASKVSECALGSANVNVCMNQEQK